jgi:hypothetical protein
MTPLNLVPFVSDATLQLANIVRVDLGLYVTTSMALWADDFSLRISGSGTLAPAITTQPMAQAVVNDDLFPTVTTI